MACSVNFLTKKLEEIKISDDVFLGNDLYYEEKFINNLNEKIEKEIDDCEVSYFLSKKSLTICCKNLTMTETVAGKLLKLADWLMDEHFFSEKWLKRVGLVFQLYASQEKCELS